VKFTPTLAFVADAIPEGAKHIDELLARAAAEDARVHEVAREAKYAGDADPYRLPHPEDEDDAEEAEEERARDDHGA
jgi:ribosome-binding factor A